MISCCHGKATCKAAYNGCVPLNETALSKLTIIISSPRHHGPVSQDSQCMILSGSNGNGVGHSDSAHSRPTNTGRPIAESSIIFKRPTPNRPICLQTNSMGYACGDRHDIINRSDPYWNRAIHPAAVAQLAVIIVTPSPDCTIGL